MLREAEQMVRPLSDVFNEVSVRNLKNQGVTGVVTLETTIGDLKSTARAVGVSMPKLDTVDHEPEIDHYCIFTRDKHAIPSLFVKGGAVHVLVDELGTFKEVFFEQ